MKSTALSQLAPHRAYAGTKDQLTGPEPGLEVQGLSLGREPEGPRRSPLGVVSTRSPGHGADTVPLDQSRPGTRSAPPAFLGDSGDRQQKTASLGFPPDPPAAKKGPAAHKGYTGGLERPHEAADPSSRDWSPGGHTCAVRPWEQSRKHQAYFYVQMVPCLGFLRCKMNSNKTRLHTILVKSTPTLP